MCFVPLKVSDRGSRWPCTARILHVLLVGLVYLLLSLENVLSDRFQITIFSGRGWRFPQVIFCGCKLKHFYEILLGIVICVSILTYVLDVSLGFCNFILRDALISGSDSSGVSPKHFTNSCLEEIYGCLASLLYFATGVCRALGIGIFLYGLYGLDRLQVSTLLAAFLEGLQVPLVLTMQVVDYKASLQLVANGFVFGLAACGIGAYSFAYPNQAIFHLISEMENVPNAAFLAERRLHLMEAMEKDGVTLYCRSRQLLCRVQKIILGVAERDDQLYNTLNEVLEPRPTFATSTRVDDPNFSKLDRFNDYEAARWQIDVAHSVYLISREEAEVKSAAVAAEFAEMDTPFPNLYAASTPTEKQNILQLLERRLRAMVQAERPIRRRRHIPQETIHIVGEDAVTVEFGKKNVHKKWHSPLFTYVEKRQRREPLSSVFNPSDADDRFGLKRNWLVECLIEHEFNELSVSTTCIPGRGSGRELEFLMAVSTLGSPSWKFEQLNTHYAGVLSLDQLEMILGLAPDSLNITKRN